MKDHDIRAIKQIDYLESEIANLITTKMGITHETPDSLLMLYKKRYVDLEVNIIHAMLKGKVNYNRVMFLIATDYLGFSIKNLHISLNTAKLTLGLEKGKTRTLRILSVLLMIFLKK